MRSKVVLALVATALWVAATEARAEDAPGAPATSTAAPAIPVEEAPVVIKAPTTLAEIDERRRALDDEKEKLRPSTQPATTQPIEKPTQPKELASNLWLMLEAYDAILAQQRPGLARLNELKDESAIGKLKDEADRIKADTQDLEAKLAANRAPAEVHRIEDVKALYTKTNQEHDAQVKAQTARQDRLNGLADRQKEAAAKAEEAKKRLDAVMATFAVRTTTAKAGPDPSLIQLERRVAELEYETALSKIEALDLEGQLLKQEQRREERRLAVLTPYVQTLRRWMNSLEEAAAADELKRIEWRLRNATKEYERVHWEAARKIQIAYKQFEAYDNPTRDRFPESAAGHLDNHVTRRETDWRNFVESLQRRSGAEVLRRYREVRKELEVARKENVQLNDWLDLSIDQREEVYRLRDKVIEEIGSKQDRLETITTRVSEEGAEKLEDQLRERRAKLDKQIAAIIALQDGLIDRLSKATDRQEKYVMLLDRTRSRLYWSYLRVRDVGLARVDLDKIRSEWRQSGKTLGHRLDTAVQEGHEQLSQAAGWQWAIASVLLIGAAPLGWRLHRTLTRRTVRLEGELAQVIQDEGMEAAGIDARLWLSVTRLLAATTILVLMLLAGFISLFVIGLGGLPLRVLATAFLFLLLIRLALGVVRALFLPSRPRFRVVRCSNVVATYYRRWLQGLIVVTALGVPVPLLLGMLDAMPTTRIYLWTIYMTVALVLVLLFTLRKQLVLKVVGRPENLRARWLYTLIAGVYPMIPVGIVGLLVLNVLGYAALTNYLIRNVLATFAILVGVAFLTRYARDLAGKYRRALQQERRSREEAKGVVHSGSAAAISAGQEVALIAEEEAREGEFFIGLAATLFNWIVRLAGLILILGVWGITLVEIQAAMNFHVAGSGEQVVTLWRVMAAIIAVAAGVFVSRSLRSVLTTRVYPAYPMLDRGARAAINTMLHYLFVILGIYVAMRMVFLEFGALTVLVGTLGLGLGLGLQPLFINFISGLIIFFERHIKVGDIIEVGDKLGEVSSISMRSTSIKTFDNIDMIIPNGEFITNQVVNWSHQDRQIRGNLTVGVAYGSDIELVRRLLLRVADEHPLVLKDPAPTVWFTDFGDNALSFRLNVWFGDLADRISSLTDLRFAIDKAFAENDITIPFPQRTVSLIDDRPLRVELARPAPDEEGSQTPPPDSP